MCGIRAEIMLSFSIYDNTTLSSPGAWSQSEPMRRLELTWSANQKRVIVSRPETGVSAVR